MDIQTLVKERCDSVIDLLLNYPLNAETWSDVMSDLEAAQAMAETEASRLVLLEEEEPGTSPTTMSREVAR